MNPENMLADTAGLFLALGDKTRLRLLNLIRDREVCVTSFTEVLGQSQPLISRHLAYLRNAGLVEVRRDGKWMYYGIATRLDENSRRLLFELFKWMEDQEYLMNERRRCAELTGSPGWSEERRAATRARAEASPRPVRNSRSASQVEQNASTGEEGSVDVRHNELEDFLL